MITRTLIASTVAIAALGAGASHADCAPGMDGCVVAASEDPVETSGYLSVRDGTSLRYELVRPNDSDASPVVLVYTTYSATNATGFMIPGLLEAGYAILSVNVRGTGCSGGRWAAWQPYTDGYDVVEWAAAQSWSTGDVGMIGASSPGISQIFTAATRPPHLRAIVPMDVATDLYGDFAYPGGMVNLFSAAWDAGIRQAGAAPGSVNGLVAGTECASNIASHPLGNEGGLTAEGAQHPWHDDWWHGLSPRRVVHEIDLPVLTCQAWQDDQLSSRTGGAGGGSWLDDLDPAQTWAVFTNGFHGTCSYTEEFGDLAVAFLDRFVRSEANGFDAQPHVQIWHESTDWYEPDPSWITTHPSWPVGVEPVALYFRNDGVLSPVWPQSAGFAGQAEYVTPLLASPMDANDGKESSTAWAAPPLPGSFLSWTTEPLTEDLEVFGSGSVDLWLSSTAVDTDVQVTLTELRPDGQEMYLQRGRLRASHRALDADASTELRPWPTHREDDRELLTPLEPTLLRVELLPVGHVFRAGSSIRITVEAPVSMTGYMVSAFLPIPAVNTVYWGPAMQSRLVLGRVPGGSAQVPMPACGQPLDTPCRADPVALN